MKKSSHTPSPITSRQAVIYALLLVMAAAVHKPLLACFQQLPYLLQSGYGESQVLPPEVWEGVGMLRRHGVEDYALSETMTPQEIYYQRFIDASYPIRLSPQSRYRVTLVQEPPPDDYRLLESGMHVRLYVHNR